MRPCGREGAPRDGPGGTEAALWGSGPRGDSLQRWEDESALRGLSAPPASLASTPRRRPGRPHRADPWERLDLGAPPCRCAGTPRPRLREVLFWAPC